MHRMRTHSSNIQNEKRHGEMKRCEDACKLDRLQSELYGMVQDDLISPVNCPADWVNNDMNKTRFILLIRFDALIWNAERG